MQPSASSPGQTASAAPEAPTPSWEEALSAENRLSAEQLTALQPRDVLTIESGQEFDRRRYCTGRVARVNASYVTVASKGAGGGKHVERYSLRDGLRLGSGSRAERVHAVAECQVVDELRRQYLRVDVLYRAWTRNRRDEEALRHLHEAIGELRAGERV